MNDWSILSITTFLPLVGVLFILLVRVMIQMRRQTFGVLR